MPVGKRFLPGRADLSARRPVQDDLFKNKAFPEIMAGILMIFDEWLKVLVMKKARLPFSCGCGGDEVALCGTYARSFHSQLGT